VKITLRRTWDDGGAAYEVDGIKGTIYVKKGFFVDGVAPDYLEISGEGLATPVVEAEAVVAEPKKKGKKAKKAVETSVEELAEVMSEAV
jgi:hypothetical protein